MFKSTEILRGVPLGIEPNILKTPMNIFIDITRKCNLSCKHCYAYRESNRELDTQEMKGLLTDIADNKVFKVIFTGGEPFLRKDFIELLEHSTNLGLTSLILSNVTSITREQAEKLSGLNIERIQTSLDGLEETHDEFRGKKGTYKDVISGIKLLIDYGINIRVNCAQLSKNVSEIDDLLELCASLGVSEFAWYRILPAGKGKDISDLAATREDISSMETHLKDLRMQYRHRMNFLYTLPGKSGPKNNNIRSEDLRVLNPGCGAGRLFCAITPDGGVKPCVFWDDSCCEFNIMDRSLREIWDRTGLFRSLRSSEIECKDCESFPICAGSCRLVAYLHGGINSRPPDCSNVCIDKREFEVKA